jgi:hypothetical protein
MQTSITLAVVHGWCAASQQHSPPLLFHLLHRVHAATAAATPAAASLAATAAALAAICTLLLFLITCCIIPVLLLLLSMLPLLTLAMQLAGIAATLVFYAPPHGLGPILTDMVAVLGGSRRAVVARELTKLHEEFYR